MSRLLKIYRYVVKRSSAGYFSANVLVWSLTVDASRSVLIWMSCGSGVSHAWLGRVWSEDDILELVHLSDMKTGFSSGLDYILKWVGWWRNWTVWGIRSFQSTAGFLNTGSHGVLISAGTGNGRQASALAVACVCVCHANARSFVGLASFLRSVVVIIYHQLVCCEECSRSLNFVEEVEARSVGWRTDGRFTRRSRRGCGPGA